MVIRPLRILQGILLYLPNTFLVSNNLGMLGLAVVSAAVYQPSIRKQDWPYFLFALGAIVNATLGIVLEGQFPASLFVNNGIAGGLLMMLTYLTARSLNDTVWKTVLFFIVIEALCIYIQFALGIRFFFSAQQEFSTLTEFEFTQDVGAETLWYYIRPQGLSPSSTVAGSKVLLGILIAYMVPMDRKWRWAIIAVLLGAVLLNFKRSGILVVGLFGAVLFLVDILQNGWHQRHTLVTAAVSLVAGVYLGTIIAQLTREQALSLEGISSTVVVTQLSGRAEIWGETLDFVRQHLFFGNYSERFTISTGQYVHNSFLSLLATHGLFLAVLLLSYYAVQVHKKPVMLIFLAPVFANAVFQEDLFWYASQFDIFLLYLLTTREASQYWLTPWPKPRSKKPSRPTPWPVAA